MYKDYGSDNKSALQAKIDAQTIAFAPIVFQAAVSLRNLGILELLNSYPKNGFEVDVISSKLNISKYGVKVLLDAGLSADIVYLKDNRYHLTKTGSFLIHDHMTKVNMDFVQDVCYNGIFHLEEAIKTEKPAGLKVFGEWPTIYHGLSELPEKVKKSWFAFDHFYSDQVFNQILPIIFKDNPTNILDVGGNTGKFALECVRYNPKVKHTIMDLPAQLQIALKNASNVGFKDRIFGHATDILNHNEAFPEGFDIVWMSQFLDCFSEEDIFQILKRALKSMSPTSRLYILETYWDRQKFDASTFCLNNTSLYFTALANGNSRMYHSNDMMQLIKKAGFEISKITDNLGISHTLIECKKQI